MTPLQLTGQEPLVMGSWRLVYQHPHDKNALIKIMRTDGKAQRARQAWYKAKPREGAYLLFSREFHEFLVSEANSDGRTRPIPRIHGLVETDLGLGMIAERLTDRHGSLAPTLEKKLAETGFTAHYERLLLDLIAEINRRRIVLVEFKLANIVVAEDDAGRERLVLVDGLGDSSLLPLHSLIQSANTRRNLRKYQKTALKARHLYPQKSNVIQTARQNPT